MILDKKCSGNRRCADYTICEGCPLYEVPVCGAAGSKVTDTLFDMSASIIDKYFSTYLKCFIKLIRKVK